MSARPETAARTGAPGRRSLLAAIATAAGGLSLPVSAAPATTGPEAGNLTLVRAFCAAWASPKIDLSQLVSTYFADDAIVRVMDSTSIARGHAAILAMLGGWLEGDRHFRLEIVSEAALGPMVMNLRHDITSSPGAAPHVDRIAGVFILADGRIKEWSDYFMR